MRFINMHIHCFFLSSVANTEEERETRLDRQIGRKRETETDSQTMRHTDKHTMRQGDIPID